MLHCKRTRMPSYLKSLSVCFSSSLVGRPYGLGASSASQLSSCGGRNERSDWACVHATMSHNKRHRRRRSARAGDGGGNAAAHLPAGGPAWGYTLLQGLHAAAEGAALLQPAGDGAGSGGQGALHAG